MSILPVEQMNASMNVDILIIGAGGCGLCAALAANESGLEVAVLERDSSALGTTSMSTGLIPAAGSELQRAAGIEDSAQIFAADINKKAAFKTNQQVVEKLAAESAQTIDWLVNQYQLPLTLVTGFTYPGHSVLRMHGMPGRSGQELMGALSQAVENQQIPLVTDALVCDLYADDDKRVHGVRYTTPAAETEVIGCRKLILACCGFAGNKDMVSKYIPEISKGEFFGHPGNKGDAIVWGLSLGAKTADMHAYQGHAGLAKGYGIPILWPIIMEGGIQLNKLGQRFSNESLGYSEQAVNVLQQPDAEAWTFYDERLHGLMLDFTDYQHALEAGAIYQADTLEEICEQCKLDLNNVTKTLRNIAQHAESDKEDEYGRKFSPDKLLQAPYRAVKVTGALFHTQGGLEVDEHARVVSDNEQPLPNLYAGGGAARGISGSGADGYIAGNGLLTATTLGRIAGQHAASSIKQEQ